MDYQWRIRPVIAEILSLWRYYQQERQQMLTCCRGTRYKVLAAIALCTLPSLIVLWYGADVDSPLNHQRPVVAVNTHACTGSLPWQATDH
jgi:hypothetical protein